jgi:alkanesulfonate monooxygenase SsuD/methylene tetrahydromethanopterin reductase-like flavin-dependent oxidoreductase (luciferase family)
MDNLVLGVQLGGWDAGDLVDQIVLAEQCGVDAAWIADGGSSPDPVTTCALAALRTERIKLGTSIVTIYGRHPLALAQQARTVAQLAPGRFRLGIGTGHRSAVEHGLGLTFHPPLGYLREYIDILDLCLRRSITVQFRGKYLQARAGPVPPVDLDLMISALRQGAFTLAGEITDGAISWLCPLKHLLTAGIAGLESGAGKAGRAARPQLIMHAAVCVDDSVNEAREAGIRMFHRHMQQPFYTAMLEDAGYTEARHGVMSRELAEDVVLCGDETRVAERIRAIAATAVDELYCSVVPVGSESQRSVERTIRLFGQLSRAA